MYTHSGVRIVSQRFVCFCSLRGGQLCAPEVEALGEAVESLSPHFLWRLVVQGDPQVPTDWEQGDRKLWAIQTVALAFGLCHFLLCDLRPVSWPL